MAKSGLRINNALKRLYEGFHLLYLFCNHRVAFLSKAVIDADTIIEVLRFGDQHSLFLKLMQHRVEGTVRKPDLTFCKDFNLACYLVAVHAAVLLEQLQDYCLQ